MGEKNNKSKELENPINALNTAEKQYYDNQWNPTQDSKQFSKYKEVNQHYINLCEQDKKLLFTKSGKSIEYREVTYDYFLNKWYKSLFMIKESNLSGIQKLRLRQLLDEYDIYGYLAEARVAKENFCDALDLLDIEWIRKVRDDCLQAKQYKILWFWKTLQKRDKQLESYCRNSTEEFKFTNAFTEAINNQCKIAKHVSMWFKTKASYKKKLSTRFHSLFNNRSWDG